MSVEYIGDEYENNNKEEKNMLNREPNRSEDKFSIDSVLESDEEILYDSGVIKETKGIKRKRKVSFSLVLVWTMMSVVVMGMCALFLCIDLAPAEVALIIAGFFSVFLLPLWIWIAQSIADARHKLKNPDNNMRYVITNKKLIIRSPSYLIDINLKHINLGKTKRKIAEREEKVKEVIINYYDIISRSSRREVGRKYEYYIYYFDEIEKFYLILAGAIEKANREYIEYKKRAFNM